MRATTRKWLLVLGGVWLCIPSPAVAAPLGIAIDSSSPYFMPKAATIAPDAPIRWENTTGSHHTITHEGCEGGGVCVFDSGTLAPDRSYELPGLPPGTYPYLCRLHPIMRGILVVQESGASFSVPAEIRQSARIIVDADSIPAKR